MKPGNSVYNIYVGTLLGRGKLMYFVFNLALCDSSYLKTNLTKSMVWWDYLHLKVL